MSAGPRAPGMSMREIASEMGIPEKTAITLMYRARKKLKQQGKWQELGALLIEYHRLRRRMCEA